MSIELSGMKELIGKLGEVQKQTSGPEMKKALKKGGGVLRDAMKRSAPVQAIKTAGSNSLEPGELRDSISVTTPKNDPDGLVVLIGPHGKAAFVGAMVEFGHRSVSGGSSKLLGNGKSRGAGKVGRDVPAAPWARPAFDESLNGVEEAIVESLKESLKEQVG